MPSYEEIDYSKFIGKSYRVIDEEQLNKTLEEKWRQRDKEDEMAAIRYKERKKALRHKYSPIRRNLSIEEKQDFIEKTQ